jgi:hypothetical protein
MRLRIGAGRRLNKMPVYCAPTEVTMGTCPKCEKRIEQVNIEGISVDAYGRVRKGISYLCPSCSCVLSVAIDPIALNVDLLRDLKELLPKLSAPGTLS